MLPEIYFVKIITQRFSSFEMQIKIILKCAVIKLE